MTALLGWSPHHQPQDLMWAASAMPHVAEAPLEDRLWTPGEVLNQGREGECVGAGVVGLAAAEPVSVVKATEDLMHEVFDLAQTMDEFPGVGQPGTSANAGMKAGRALGYWEAWRHCFGTRDIAQTVVGHGPVGVGVPWFSGMYSTDSAARVDVAGHRVGGHFLIIDGFLTEYRSIPGPWFRWLNSWGPTYGDQGHAYIWHQDLARLLAGRGEAVTPVQELLQ